MKTYTGLTFLFWAQLVAPFSSNPRLLRSSCYGTAPALSILLPKTTIGTFSSYGIYSTPCS